MISLLTPFPSCIAGLKVYSTQKLFGILATSQLEILAMQSGMHSSKTAYRHGPQALHNCWRSSVVGVPKTELPTVVAAPSEHLFPRHRLRKGLPIHRMTRVEL